MGWADKKKLKNGPGLVWLFPNPALLRSAPGGIGIPM